MSTADTPAYSRTIEERAAIKCPCCAVPWADHTDICSRHDYRPTAPAPVPVTAGRYSVVSPVIRGTRVTVRRVVSLIVSGRTWTDIIRYYPELTEDDIRACLLWHLEQSKATT